MCTYIVHGGYSSGRWYESGDKTYTLAWHLRPTPMTKITSPQNSYPPLVRCVGGTRTGNYPSQILWRAGFFAVGLKKRYQRAFSSMYAADSFKCLSDGDSGVLDYLLIHSFIYELSYGAYLYLM